MGIRRKKQTQVTPHRPALVLRIEVPALDPERFCCPITREVMTDPVIAADGFTYERAAITRWLQTHPQSTSPITRQPLDHRHLFPNRALRDLIENDMRQQKQDITMHPVNQQGIFALRNLNNVPPAQPQEAEGNDSKCVIL